jgi:hypothetical protein
MRKALDEAKLSALGADEINAAFDAARKKALESLGGVTGWYVPEKRDLPQGVYKATYGKKFVSRISWGGKDRYIGTFDTSEQASHAYMSLRKDRDDVELSALSADEVDALFDAAKKKVFPEKRDLPRGVYKTPYGNF